MSLFPAHIKLPLRFMSEQLWILGFWPGIYTHEFCWAFFTCCETPRLKYFETLSYFINNFHA